MPSNQNTIPALTINSVFRRALDDVRHKMANRTTQSRIGVMTAKPQPQAEPTETFSIGAYISDTPDISDIALRNQHTKLYNQQTVRRKLANEVKRAKRYGDSFAVVLLQLLPEIAKNNGSEGELVAMQTLAKGIKESTRDIDICGHWGDKFVVMVLPSTDMPGAEVVTNRVRNFVRMKPVSFYWQNLYVDFEAVAGVFSKDSESVEDLFADLEMQMGLAMKQVNTTLVTKPGEDAAMPAGDFKSEEV